MEDSHASLKRLSRYARLSTGVGGLLARVLGEKYLGLSWDHQAYAPVVQELLGNLKGPVMKIGQILATVPDMLPPEYVQEFLLLQSCAPAMGWGFVRRRMAAELGPDWQKLFHVFTPQAAAAASLGQVHQAVSLEGIKLACKLQYPDMASAVAADLKQLSLFCAFYEKYAGALDTKNVQQEIAARLAEELDYEAEARHVQWFSKMLDKEAGIHVPQVYPDLSTSRLLTMTWLEGKPFLEAQEVEESVRVQIAKNLFTAWYLPLYHYGVLHGDPHLGNYTLSPEPGQLNMLDFGCVRVFPPKFIEGVVHLYHALLEKDEERAVYAYEAWGFETITRDLLSVLNLWAEFLYGPLLEDCVRPIDKDFSGHSGKEVAFSVHEQLKKMGGIRPPREFVFMDRAAVGIGSAFIHLKVQMNWHRLFTELIADFSIEQMEKKQNALVLAAQKTKENPSGACNPNG